MTNLSAVKSLCNAIANTFYPDKSAIEICLFNEGIDANADATPKDVAVFRVAIRLVKGYVEGSRTDGGISLSVASQDAIKKSLIYWCNYYGLDADEELSDYERTIENASNLW